MNDRTESEWTKPLDDCPSWCDHHRIDQLGIRTHHRYVWRLTNNYSQVDLARVTLTDTDVRAAYDDARDYGPSLSLITWPNSQDPHPPLALDETDARRLVRELAAALEVIAREMPERCTRCREHCRPDDAGLCWHCSTADQITANQSRRDNIAIVKS